MPKQYTPAAPFNDIAEYIEIPMTSVESHQVAAIGYDPESKTLAVTFTRGPGHIYQYPGVEPEVHAAFIAAESIGKYFGEHIKPLPFKKFPAPVAA
ncbi:KTSC domain-containing protein [Variovorax sp. WS11]|uniref:KTSC domain-containing protein n=1 Tax=Variovorax sp. WS11 TaxID=1105204 RepID=UPI000D0CF3DA|nr:KTSC domain-containing protein [Variovorax sp. WS11]NDZ11528.1 KTSC domain-containing protein [Variovorax sp. WS11]PSL86618.1 KTSC domain-containing protein [Variovorax sp. WS11]